MHQPRVNKPHCTPGPDLPPSECTVLAVSGHLPHRQTGQGRGSATLSVTPHVHGSRGPPGTQPKAEPYRSLFRAILGGVQVGVLHGLHLWTPQEVVQCVEGVGDQVGDGLGAAGGPDARGWSLDIAGGAPACGAWRGRPGHLEGGG